MYFWKSLHIKHYMSLPGTVNEEEINLNVYDFDGTIFYTDCTIGFAIWCTKRHPELCSTFWPGITRSFIQYKRKELPNYKLQRRFFSYLTMIDDFDVQIERYWDKYEKKISKWYLEQKRPDDLIISASPDCIIGPIAKRLGVHYVATEYDREYGVFLNNLMYAKEKAKYIFDHGFPVIENFYSDSLSDTPLALCAEKAYIVKHKGTIVVDWPELVTEDVAVPMPKFDAEAEVSAWPDLDKETMEIVKEEIDSGWNVHLKED